MLALILACDMSRVIPLVAPLIEPSVFGYPVEASLHDGYAHSSVDDGNETFKPLSETVMVEYNKWYAARFAPMYMSVGDFRPVELICPDWCDSRG